MDSLIDWSHPWGVLSDAHGNPAGLRECVKALRAEGAHTLFFLGDAVGYLPLETEVLLMLAQERMICISGNHEAMLLGHLPVDSARDRIYGIRTACARLSREALDEVARWADRLILRVPGSDETFMMVHGSPALPWDGYIYPDTDISNCEALGHSVIFVGQTHRPFIRESGRTRVINVGSCGLPRDIGNLASCALFDPTIRSARILRVVFDTDRLLTEAGAVAQVPETVRACLDRRPA